jgi:ligand-binding SRPBCC domain-containing protein
VATVEVRTRIRAPIGRCFDLARSVDLHLATAHRTGERAVGGVTAGLLDAGDAVTWRARHLGRWYELTVRITAFDAPTFFRDEQVRGPFARFRHDHRFRAEGGETVMTDALDVAAPLGPLGAAVTRLVLVPHLRRFVAARAQALRAVAESEDWRRYVATEAATVRPDGCA